MPSNDEKGLLIVAFVFAITVAFLLGVGVGDGMVRNEAVRAGTANWGKVKRGEPAFQWIVPGKEGHAGD